MSWKWVPQSAVLAIHDEQLWQHGGLDGVRDVGAVESALARPLHLAAYGQPDAADLAAAYAFGLAKNHGFADGNKRTAWIVANVFLDINGMELNFQAEHAYAVVCGVADGSVSECELAAWFRERLSR
jgi:death on curing protein